MFEIAAHRAGNSWNSINSAIDSGYDYIELDVHLSKDGMLIVQYSPFIEIDSKQVYIQDINYATLSDIVKDKVILLLDVLNYVKNKIKVVIDVKRGHDFYCGIGTKIAQMVKHLDMSKQCWVIAFDHCCLLEAKKIYENLNIAPMYVARINNEKKYWKELCSDGVEICNDYLDIYSVKNAHCLNMKVLGWCTKDLDELSYLADIGLDIITVEQDDVFLNHLKKIQRSAKD